jgi:hypothetical protein
MDKDAAWSETKKRYGFPADDTNPWDLEGITIKNGETLHLEIRVEGEKVVWRRVWVERPWWRRLWMWLANE